MAFEGWLSLYVFVDDECSFCLCILRSAMMHRLCRGLPLNISCGLVRKHLDRLELTKELIHCQKSRTFLISILDWSVKIKNLEKLF